MNNGITELILIGLSLQQVKQTILTYIALPIKVDHQSCVEVTVIPELVVEVFLNKMKMLEHGIVRNKCYHSSILFLCSCFFVFFDQNTSFKLSSFFFAFPESSNFKIIAQSIYSLGTHTVQANTFLKSLAIIFRTCIDLANHIHYLPQR